MKKKSNPSSPILTFRQVFFSYQETPILHNVSLEIFPKEMIGIIGPNGEGKTTAIKLSVGLLTPNQGDILLGGKPPTKRRHWIGYVPQTCFYDKQFPISALEVVLTGAIPKVNWIGYLPKKEKEHALSLMKQLGLQGLENKPFGSLSGGQAQKTLLARALIGNPSILFLDEPTANIDPQSEETIFTFLKALTKEKTIIIVTHNFDAIMRYMDRVLCFQKTVTSLQPKEVCKHFTMGMYHPTKSSHV